MSAVFATCSNGHVARGLLKTMTVERRPLLFRKIENHTYDMYCRGAYLTSPEKRNCRKSRSRSGAGYDRQRPGGRQRGGRRRGVQRRGRAVSW